MDLSNFPSLSVSWKSFNRGKAALVLHPTTLYRTPTGLNNHASSKHGYRYRKRGDVYIPLTAEERQRAHEHALAGQARRRRTDPADKEDVALQSLTVGEPAADV